MPSSGRCRRSLPALAAVALSGLIIGCGPVDQKALQKLACEQAAASLDMQSVSTLDMLRRALGVAPGVDPIRHCRSLGVVIEPAPSGAPAGSSRPQGAEAAAPEAEPDAGDEADRDQ